jgi:hypothetical protein
MKPKGSILGVYNTDLDITSLPKATMEFRPLNLISKWQRCSLTANFISTLHSKEPKPQDKLNNIVSTILNELLESAIRYSADKNKTINMGFSSKGSKLYFELTLTCDTLDAFQFQRFYRNYLDKEPTEDTILKLIEADATSEKTSFALGLLSLKHDYNAEIGFKIEPEKRHLYKIATLIIINTGDEAT